MTWKAVLNRIMLTQTSLLAVSLSDLGPDSNLLWIGQCECDLPSFEAKGVIHWSYPELFLSAAHFFRRSQQISVKEPVDPNKYFGIACDEIKISQLGESDWTARLAECMNGTPFLDIQLKPLGHFHWAVSLYDDWDVHVTMAHVGRHYYATYWETWA